MCLLDRVVYCPKGFDDVQVIDKDKYLIHRRLLELWFHIFDNGKVDTSSLNAVYFKRVKR